MSARLAILLVPLVFKILVNAATAITFHQVIATLAMEVVKLALMHFHAHHVIQVH
jgi:hypothetical protein